MNYLAIKKSELSESDFNYLCQKIAEIEQLVMHGDAWHAQAIAEMMGQFGTQMLIQTDHSKTDNSKSDIDWRMMTIKGYCIYQRVFENSELHRIGTHPNFQRQGAATQLMTGLIAEVMHAKCQQLLLEVRSDNTTAITLYQSLGFLRFGVRKNYYRFGNQSIDALIMRLGFFEDTNHHV